MERLSWVTQMGPVQSQGSLSEKGREVRVRGEVTTQAEVGKMWAQGMQAAFRS